MMRVKQIAAWLLESRLHGDGDIEVLRVHTDTRTLQAGDLFVALRGEKFDANDFLSDAKTKGAVAAIAERGLDAAALTGVEVQDSKLALGQLAKAWRAQFKLPVIAVTGSNGKTTVTQMLASILRAYQGAAAHATEGNLNNDIGVPLTLLRMTAAHQIAVIELGMNHPGEIAYLADITQPSVALVNNAQREHLEFMQTVEAVAKENASVFASLPEDGVCVFPADEEYTALWRELAAARRCICFGEIGTGADVFASSSWAHGAWQIEAQTPAGVCRFSLKIAGKHNVRNALAALAAALGAGVPLASIEKGLTQFQAVKGRSCAILLRGDKTLVDDTYNANPDSMLAAINVLKDLPGPRLLVIGDMGEVGENGQAFHEEIGHYAKAQGIETLYALGDLAEHAATAGGGKHFQNVESLIDAACESAARAESILVKGSRFMKMERVVQAIQEKYKVEDKS